MKTIQKGGAPHVYKSWCGGVAGTDKADYREIPKRLKAELLSCLLAEQGWICGYTMKRLNEGCSHIEHIKPESRCREDVPGSDLEYGNLIACFPREGMPRQYRYGAQEKDNWWQDGGCNFVSPLHDNCERRFQFDLAGNIKAITNAAAITIGVLGLAHPTLIEERKRVVEEFVYGETNESLSDAEAERALNSVCDRNGDGYFREFCVAIRDALKQYIKNLERLRNKRRFAQRRKA